MSKEQKKNNKKKYDSFFGISIIVLIIAIIIIFWAYSFVVQYKEDSFCMDKYPPKIKETSVMDNNFGSTLNVEPGFIKCCREVYINHTKTYECKIFEFIK